MHPSTLPIELAFSGPALAVRFTSPPPPLTGTAADFGANPVYAEGSAIEAAWTDTEDNDIPFSVVVYQADSSNGDIPANQAFEYVVHNAVNISSSHWVVATAKNLAFSNVFVLSIFFQGDTAGRALSHFFNISSKFTDQGPQQATQTVTVSATATLTSSSTWAAASTPLEANDGTLGTAAKVGLAVGVVAALALGIVVGWFLARRNRSGNGYRSEKGMRGSDTGLQTCATAGLGITSGGEAAVPEKDTRMLPQRPRGRDIGVRNPRL
ncbi:hypothetical protein N657DRAFT_674322 [Parathielavia appendiculata]|uniref:Uncharacterized protein n=1 Tax=Parathielavia appendiculata TaxID=2587402 RepID=A0AAN6TSZ9_9PEZI|nr:hypothetical protein N657DRAFT_674322 [Parathielavia appendiculata]